MTVGSDRGVGAGGMSKSSSVAKFRRSDGVAGGSALFAGDGVLARAMWRAKLGCVCDFVGESRARLDGVAHA